MAENFTWQRDEFGFPIKIPIKKPKSAKKLEGGKEGVQAAIAAVFIADGWEVIRYNSGTFKVMLGKIATWFTANRNLNTGATTGHPDMGVYRNCTGFRIEAKTETGTLSPAQKEYAANALLFGNPIVVLRSEEEAIELRDLIKVKTIQSAIAAFQNNHLKGKRNGKSST